MAPETPKGVSSRLLTMKFMQRAAASNSAPSTPGSDTDGHSAKKRKLGHDAAQARFMAEIDKASIQAAIDEREAKRLAALEKHSANDNHWTLDTNWGKNSSKIARKPLQVVYVGYGDIASSDDETQDDPKAGRTFTKHYKQAKPVKESKKKSSVKEPSDDDSDEDDHTQETPVKPKSENSPHSEQSRKRKFQKSSPQQTKESSKAKEFREKRKQKEVKLSSMEGISGRGGPTGKVPKCKKCLLPGHKTIRCPGIQ